MITPETLTELEKQLEFYEGCELRVYKDSLGLYSIGIGRCLVTKGLTKNECDRLNLGVYTNDEVISVLKIRGITDEEAKYLFFNDVMQIQDDCDTHISFFDTLPEDAKLVLLAMCFQLGIGGLLKFKNTLSLIESGDYKAASVEMLDSEWAKQTPARAKEMSAIMAEV